MPNSTKGLSPGTRTALIIGGLFSFFIIWTIYWVAQKAFDIKRQRLEATRVSTAQTGDMIWIPAGSFTMGGNGEQAAIDESPLHDVKLNGFWIDRTEVTNEQFARFEKATSYVTTAERTKLSLCFRKPAEGDRAWQPVAGADWRHPDGPESNLAGKEKYPVVHVNYEDAEAYCKWAAKRLPTESEWEYAARGGAVAQPYVWGSEMNPGGRWMANTWQGKFPLEHKSQDGFENTAPVGSFPANGYGLLDMAGNVAEWTSDWYRPDTYEMIHRSPARVVRKDPHGPIDSFDPDEPGVWKKVVRGGSYLSSDHQGQSYRPSARMKTAPESSRQDTGFRCVKDGGE